MVQDHGIVQSPDRRGVWISTKKISQACMACSVGRELMLNNKETSFSWQRCFTACALELPQNRSHPSLDVEQEVWQQFSQSSCAQKANTTILEERRRNAEALVLWLDLHANSPQTLQFHLDLIDHFIEIGARQNVLELGVGNSVTTILLSVLFCKVIAIDPSPSIFAEAVSRGLANVLHLQADSDRASWRPFAESELINVVVMDAAHGFKAGFEDIIASFSLTHKAPQPRVVLRDFNFLGVRAVTHHFMTSGALYNCTALGLNLTVAEARNPDLPSEEQFPEGLICRVDEAKAKEIAEDPRPQIARRSLLEAKDRVWQLYEASDRSIQIGTLQVLEGRSNASGTMLISDAFSSRRWAATWLWEGLGSSSLRISFITGSQPQNGTMMFNRARTALIATFDHFPLSTLDHNRSRWMRVPRVEVFSEQSLEKRPSSILRLSLSGYPFLHIYGISQRVLDREFDDMQAQYLATSDGTLD